MSSLKNIQLTFGDTASSPKVLTSSQIEKIIKTIQRNDITTVYSGYITCNTPISSSNTFILERNGITYLGPSTLDEYTIEASKSSIAEGDSITISANGVLIESLIFTIKDVLINSEGVTKQEVLNALQIIDNKIKFNSLNKKVNVVGIIVIESNTKYKPDNKKTLNLSINSTHSSGLNVSYTKYDYDTTKDILNFNKIGNKTITVAPTVVGNIPLNNLDVRFENETINYTIVNTSSDSITIRCNNTDVSEPNKLIINAKEVLGYIVAENVEVNIDNRVITIPSIKDVDNIIAENGICSINCIYEFNPDNYTVPVRVKHINATIGNGNVEITNSTIGGFTLNVTNNTENTSITVTAIITVDKKDITISKTIGVTYKQIFNEFKVYVNSAWIVPISNVEIKVGDIPATYIGDGLWMVDHTLVDSSMDVTAGGVVLGKYGENEYTDGSSKIRLSKNELKKLSYSAYARVIYDGKDYNPFGIIPEKPFTLKLYGTFDGTNLIFSSVNKSNGCCNINVKEIRPNGLEAELSYTLSSDYSTYGLGFNSASSNYKNLSFIESTSDIFNPLNSDLSLPSTHLIAKNGILNELITPTTPNTNVILTNITSSNANIVAAIIDDKIKLTGTIDYGATQTIKLTIGYTVNEYSRSVEVDVTATYQESYDDDKLKAVDLGLPSGLRWANFNVGAEKLEDPGLYFQFGDTEGHKKDSEYSFDNTSYQAKGLNSISANLTLEQDAARANMGGEWRMPTKNEFDELYENTNVTWITVNGVVGCKFANKTDASKYIFIPAAGYYDGSSLNDWCSGGYCWSTMFYNSSLAFCFFFSSSNQCSDSFNRYYGYTVRGVC